MPGPYLSQADAPLLNLGLYLMRFDYFLPEIRFKGNAYGAGIAFDDGLGLIHMHSYDDPRVRETLEVFERLPEAVRKADWSQADIDRAIIGSAKAVERPIRPAEATALALIRFLRGDSDELREQRYAASLRATPATVRAAVLSNLQAGLPNASTCVLSSREKLEEANRHLADKALTLSDVL
jgi:Zn-dependent M16 (insulinase) family peptidase